MGLIKDNHVYSYSQLSSFDECPYSFYLQRIERVDNIMSNAFSERGSLIHDLLDKWAKGILKKEDMKEEYIRRYADEVVTAFPSVMRGYAEKAYYSGIDFLENFDEFEGYKVESAEEKFTIDLPLCDGSTRKFTGIIDLILREQWTNDLVICDHKSKSMASFKKSENEMYRQQLLYSLYVYEKYGEYPKTLMFHLFGENGEKPFRAFDLKQFRETLSWASDCIHKIEGYTVLDWLTDKDSSDFYCQNLCNVRKNCNKSVEKPLTKKEKEELKARREVETNKSSSENNEPAIEENAPVEKKNKETVKTVLTCENCGAPYEPGKRKCPHCKTWYKTRKVYE